MRAVRSISIEDKIGFRCYLAAGEQEGRGIKVKILFSIVAVDIPAKPNMEVGQAAMAFCQINFLTFYQIYHEIIPLFP